MRSADEKVVKPGQSLIETLTDISAFVAKQPVNLQYHFLQEIRAMTTGLSDFFHFHLWANLRLLDACACLSDAQLDATSQGMFGSVRETLVHIFVADENYVEDLTGTAPPSRLEEFTMFAGFDELRQRAEWSGKELITIAEQRDLDQIIHFPNYDIRGIIILLQALHHAIEHRSQIATLLSLQDIELPLLDGWGYNNALTGQSGE